MRSGADLPLLVLVGPSGAGKSTLLHELVTRHRVLPLRTLTTRPRRRGEGEDTHEFVDADELRRREEAGDLLGTHEHYGHRYGLPRVPPGRPTATCLRAVVLPRLRALHPRVHVVACEAPLPVLLERILARGDEERADPVRLADELRLGRAGAGTRVDTTQPLPQCLEQVLTGWRGHP